MEESRKEKKRIKRYEKPAFQKKPYIKPEVEKIEKINKDVMLTSALCGYVYGAGCGGGV